MGEKRNTSLSTYGKQASLLHTHPGCRPGFIWDRLKGVFRSANDNVSCFCMRPRRQGGLIYMGSAMGPDGVGSRSTCSNARSRTLERGLGGAG